MISQSRSMLRGITRSGFGLLSKRALSYKSSCVRPLSTTTDKINVTGSHPNNNVPQGVAQKIGTNLHQQKGHPLNIIKERVELFFKTNERETRHKYSLIDNLSPIVEIEQNFDALLIPKDHVSRQPTDTYYVDGEHCLRCHTSAHQNELMKAGHMAFLCTGDVYRRDEIDRTHYPVFHQMEGVCIFDTESIGPSGGPESVNHVKEELKETLEGLAKFLFGDVKMRWVEAYFPFTEPSLELEVYFNDEWLEVLGCGVIEREIMVNCGIGNKEGWAFGLGLERLAMILFDIPDIRLFWSNDERFLSQFRNVAADCAVHDLPRFQPFSKYPACYKDVSFWLSETFHENDLYELIREEAGDIVEDVQLIDQFVHPKTQRESRCYRINYRSMERSLMNSEINELQETVRARLVDRFDVELR